MFLNLTIKNRVFCLAAILFFLFNGKTVFSQPSNLWQVAGAGSWQVDFSGNHSFIENKGQFKNRTWQSNTDILYAVECYNGFSVFMTKNGLTYRFDKFIKKPDRAQGEPKKINVSELINVIWLNSNPDPEIIASEPVEHYYSYAIRKPDSKDVYNENNIPGYKKLLYRNLYNNIDVEYEISKEGLKYILHVRPGADLSQVKMKYLKRHTNISSESIETYLNEEGNLQIKCSLGELTELKPYTFYQDNKSEIKSSFKFENDILSFDVDYDKTRGIVIDPWVVSATFNSSTAVWEVETDGTGNVYVIGGETPMRLQKYSIAGALQWTYNTPWDTNTVWLGTLATDASGTSYITSGTAPEMERITTAGTMVWHNNGGGGIFTDDEWWSITFNCDKTRLIVGGTTLNMLTFDSWATIFNMDLTNGNVLSSQNVAYTSLMGFGAFPIEVRSITSSKDAKYVFLTHHEVGAINQNIGFCPNSQPVFQVDNGHHLGYKCEDYLPATQNGGGLKALTANGQFVYTHSGDQVHKRSLVNGAIITTVNLPGGNSTNYPPPFSGKVVSNSGLDVDNCGNVYAGSGDRVVKFDANLNILQQTNVNFTVYDVSVNSNGEVIAVGAQADNQSTNRNGRIESINMSACAQFALICCDANICLPDTFCLNDPATNLLSSSGGGVWSGPGITNPATGTFDPSVAGQGVHTITYTQACGSDSVQVVVSPCVALTACQEANGDITITNGVGPFTWEYYTPASSTPITNQTDCQNCGYTWFFGQCLDGVVPVTTCDVPASWTTFATGTTATPVQYPIVVTDGVGSSITINSLSELPNCSPCPPLTITPANIVSASCGNNNGSFSVSTSGGASPYDYVLQNSGGSTVATFNNVAGSQSFTNLGADTYTVIVTDNNNCTGTINVTVPQTGGSVNPVISGSTSFCAGGSTILDAGGYTGYLWTGGATTQTITVTAAGSYSVTVTDASGCTGTASVTVTIAAGLTPTITGTLTICSGASTILDAGSGYDNYLWSTSATTQTITVSSAGTYSVTVTNGGGGPSVFWTEDFQNGCASGCNATGYSGTNGAWSVTNTGLNGADANAWFVSGSECGNAAGACGSGCGATDPSLHVGSTTIGNDPGAAYMAGGLGFWFPETDKRAESPVINCTGKTNITLAFNYIENGQNVIDNADLWYYDGTTWNPMIDLPKTALTCSPQGLWTAYSIALPASADNNPNVKIGFRWVNNDDNVGTDPSFAVDDITLSSASAGSCSGSDAVNVTVGANPTPTITGTLSICSGSSTILDAGVGYTNYIWSTSATSQTISVSAAGTYSVTVTNASGCTGTAQATVTISSTLSPVITGALSFCTGGNTTLDAGAGYSSYVWSTTAITQTIPVTTGGNYSVTVSDASGCTGSATVTVTVSTSLTPTVTGNNLCTGGSTTLDAGSGYLTYSWSTGDTIQTIVAYSPNTYSVTVSDATGCTGSGQITITTNPNPTPAITGLLTFCTGYSTTLDAGAGFSAYSWSDASISQSISVSSAGNYSVTVTDSNGCTGTDQVTVTVSNNLTPAIAGNLQLCFGSSTTLNAGSGYSSYLWTTGQTLQSISVTSGGNYSVTVSDATGCTGTDTVTVVVNPAPTPNITGNTAFCSNSSTTLDAGAGYNTYLWSTGATSQTISVSATGTYGVSVTNSFGCGGIDTINVTASAPVVVSVTPTSSLCYGAWAYISASATGGTPPYTYYWDSIPGGSAISVQPTVSTNYSVYVVDMMGCTSNLAVANVIVSPPLQIDVVAVPSAICPNETVELFVNVIQGGGPPFTIFEPNGNVLTPPYMIYPQASGYHIILVKDGCGAIDSDSVYVTVNSSPPVDFVCDTLAGCEPLTVSFLPVNPQPGQSYLWNFGDGSYNQITYEMNPTHIFQNDGVYDVSLTITNSTGCSTTLIKDDLIHVYPLPFARFITDPLSASIIKPEVHFINLSEGASSYIWSFGDGDSSSKPNPWHWYPAIGSYVVTLIATSDMGCTDTAERVFTIRDEYTFYAPNCISPDFDDQNDVFFVLGHGISSKNFYLYIFDRWGEIIYETDMYDEEQPWKYGWNGTVKGGEIAPVGSYVWMVKYQDGDKIQHDRSGVVHVIR